MCFLVESVIASFKFSDFPVFLAACFSTGGVENVNLLSSFDGGDGFSMDPSVSSSMIFLSSCSFYVSFGASITGGISIKLLPCDADVFHDVIDLLYVNGRRFTLSSKLSIPGVLNMLFGSWNWRLHRLATSLK